MKFKLKWRGNDNEEQSSVQRVVVETVNVPASPIVHSPLEVGF